jgi:hypothetical protein
MTIISCRVRFSTNLDYVHRVPSAKGAAPPCAAKELGMEPLPRPVAVPSFDPELATSKASHPDSGAGQCLAHPAKQRGSLFTRQRSQVQNLPRPPPNSAGQRPYRLHSSGPAAFQCPRGAVNGQQRARRTGVTAEYLTVLRAPSAALLLPDEGLNSPWPTRPPGFAFDLGGETRALNIPFLLTYGLRYSARAPASTRPSAVTSPWQGELPPSWPSSPMRPLNPWRSNSRTT